MGVPDVRLRRVRSNGIELNVAVAGAGPPVVLLHGWPHTWRLWDAVVPALAARHTVLAPDLRGLGDSTRAAGGYDAGTVAADIAGLLEALGTGPAALVAIDAGVAAAFVLALREPARVGRLVLMEGLVPGLPGGPPVPPWWFGFHQVPGLAETVVAGREAAYLDWFLASGTAGGRGVDPSVRDAFVRAYTGVDALRCGFEYYRALPAGAGQVTALLDRGHRLVMPTMAVGAAAVGDALHRQLAPVTDDLEGRLVVDCGHLIPADRPDALLELLGPFLARAR